MPSPTASPRRNRTLPPCSLSHPLRILVAMGYRGKVADQTRARELRVEGWTYAEICTELGVAKSSVSLWCRDIEVDEEKCPRVMYSSTTVIRTTLGLIDALLSCDVPVRGGAIGSAGDC